jgi:N-methylhydantoinase A/oxoprolinase/acetone carboxylase beta subunit
LDRRIGGDLRTIDRVGPDSAGANPGPASYRRGGPLAVTDANVMLGKIQPAYFPHVFGADGDRALDAERVQVEFAALAAKIGDGRPPEAVAEGFVQIAVGNMANAIKHISVQRGHDVTEYVLCCFGGAAGQHACLVADALAMTRVFIHPLAGVLSAYGMGLADQTEMREKAVEAKLGAAALDVELEALAKAAADELMLQGVEASRIRVLRRVHLKYEGTDTALIVPFGSEADMTAAFEAAYRKQFSFLMPGKSLIVEAVSVEALSAGESFRPVSRGTGGNGATEETRVRFIEASHPVSRPMAPPALPRTSSSGSGFFFCGIRLDPVVTASASSKKPNSSDVKMMTSSARRERWVIASAAAKRKLATKSRSPEASMLFLTTRLKPSLEASHAVSTG